MIKHLLTFPLIILFLIGCSSKPREVKANIDLVEKQTNVLGKKMPAKYRSELESSSETKLTHSDYDIEMGPFFISALGQDCRSLSIVDKSQQVYVRVVCAEKRQYKEQVRVWLVMPDVVQTSEGLEL